MKPSCTHAESGFTMVVIAALFVAFAVIASIAVERNTVVQQITRRDAAAAQLSRLATAIIEYSVFNKSGTTNLYPCPARLDVAITDADFGRGQDDGTPSKVPNCHSTLPVSGITQTGTSNHVLIGMVPVQTLSQYGIGINDAFDPWNNRILYIVNRTQTPGGTPDQTNNPTIGDPWSTVGFPNPDFILISLGKDGVGATKRNATSVAIACGSSTSYRLENCDGDAIFYYMPTYTASNAQDLSTPTSPLPRNYFDDILTFYRQ